MRYKGKFIASREEVIGLLRSGFPESQVAKHYHIPEQNIHYYTEELKRINGSGEFVCEECGKTFERKVSLNGHISATGHRPKAYVENVDVAGNCIVCQSPDREAIDKALKEGVSLRTIETKYKVSRSSLSRHTNNCLNQGGIKLPINDIGFPEEEIMSVFFKGFQNALTGYKKIPELEEEIIGLKHDNKDLLSANHQLADEGNRWQSKAESLLKRHLDIQQLMAKPD